MQAGEVLRRVAFNALDYMKGGKLNRIKKVNKREIVDGVTDEYVERRLQALMDYTRKNSAFYREYGELNRLEDFPVMNKTDYLNHMQEVLCDDYQEGKNKVYTVSTSGSTGAPFHVLCNPDKMDRINMNFISTIELRGFRIGMKRAEFRVWIPGKNTITKWKSFKNNLIMIDISNMGDDALEKICDTIKKKRVQALVAYSSALTVLAQYIRRKQIDVQNWDVEFILSMGEALPQATYDDLLDIFGFAPIRSYGNNENGFIAIQLPDDERYTVDLYNYYMEILKLDSDEPAEPGELGRMVVTDYYNRAFPMIRYDTGDTGIYFEEHDAKGRKHGYFTEIYGRRGSMMYNCKGEPLSIHVFLNVLINLEGVVHQAKCIQWEKKRYEILLNADRDKVNVEEVVDAYRRYLGEEARIDVTYVDEIPIQASGKRMVCENRCPDYQ